MDRFVPDITFRHTLLSGIELSFNDTQGSQALPAFAYRTFALPTNYLRTNLVPDITGVQICADTRNGFSANITLDVNELGYWTNLVQGSYSDVIGAEKEWLPIFFNRPVTLPAEYVNRQFRIGVQSDDPVYFESGGLAFKLMTFTADSGEDFLSNQYRSIVRRSKANSFASFTSDTNSFWYSKPNPSKYAVESLYFDVRPNPHTTTYAVANEAIDPNVDSDVLDGGYVNYTSSTIVTDDELGHAWENSKNPSTNGTAYRYFGWYPAPNDPRNISVTSGEEVFLRVSQKVVAPGPGTTSFRLAPLWLRANGTDYVGTVLATSNSPTTDSWVELTGRTVAPSDAVGVAIAAIYTWTPASGSNLVVRITRGQILTNPGPDDPEFAVGNMAGYVWAGAPTLSPTLKATLNPNDTPAVIDRVLIDPITPGVYFNLYYSNEGDPGVSDSDWESKLWTPVYQTYRADRREEHMLPEPIKARYVKIEFSHLQAQHYSPGTFSQATRYKKHPKWVLDYFLTRLDAEQTTGDAFVASQVRVVYNALQLGYDYYLDDLHQTADTPTTQELENFLRAGDAPSSTIDQDTLNRVRLGLDPYTQQPAERITGLEFLISAFAQDTLTKNYPVEQKNPAKAITDQVSQLNRESLIVEQNFPVMFFYVTCRHKYRELEANFEQDRAYFVGIRELAFVRDQYTTASDQGTYIENLTDFTNVIRNDFIES
jgi:hypothetical protein